MGIGITEIQESKVERARSGATSGGSGGEGPFRGGGGGNRGTEPFEFMEASNERVRLVTWFIMLAVLMTFVGLIAAYVYVSSNGVLEWRPFDLPKQIWVSTLLIVCSSVSYSVAHWMRRGGKQQAARSWLLVTTVIGAAFIASQILSWVGLYKAGLYMSSNPYAGFFYFITFMHAVHVLGGVCALGFAVLRTWVPTDSAEEIERRLVVSKAVGQYWHFMDGLWVLLVLMFGFWK